ncbi:hypothetical protein Taro_026324 [Colocasia esculenta]|uniref:Uncharacterized protein n=1 Tax=Colocasia esculenta TaxID=4460 RepID=A0A843VB39_COLES|nr:hypothetical protein [Colocasia esculenta]
MVELRSGRRVENEEILSASGARVDTSRGRTLERLEAPAPPAPPPPQIRELRNPAKVKMRSACAWFTAFVFDPTAGNDIYLWKSRFRCAPIVSLQWYQSQVAGTFGMRFCRFALCMSRHVCRVRGSHMGCALAAWYVEGVSGTNAFAKNPSCRRLTINGGRTAACKVPPSRRFHFLRQSKMGRFLQVFGVSPGFSGRCGAMAGDLRHRRRRPRLPEAARGPARPPSAEGRRRLGFHPSRAPLRSGGGGDPARAARRPRAGRSRIPRGSARGLAEMEESTMQDLHGDRVTSSKCIRCGAAIYSPCLWITNWLRLMAFSLIVIVRLVLGNNWFLCFYRIYIAPASFGLVPRDLPYPARTWAGAEGDLQLDRPFGIDRGSVEPEESGCHRLQLGAQICHLYIALIEENVRSCSTIHQDSMHTVPVNVCTNDKRVIVGKAEVEDVVLGERYNTVRLGGRAP